MRDDTGGIAHFVAIKQDVTARKKAEFELRAERDIQGGRSGRGQALSES